jgi:hypothetical protein
VVPFGLIVLVLGELTAITPEPPPAPPAREQFGAEMRVGGQLPRAFPSVALYFSTGLAPDLSIGLGYEVIRAVAVTVPKSCQTVVSPAIMSSLRAGVWRRLRLPSGFALRGGLLAGVASPALSPVAFPDGTSGAAAELAIDLAASWSWRALHVSLYLTPTYALGSLANDFMCSGQPGSTAVSAPGLEFGLGIAVRL